MELDQKAEQLIAEFKDKMRAAAEEVIEGAYCDLLPHVEFDTMMNVSTAVQRAIDSLIAGDAKQDGEYAVIRMGSEPDVRIKVTDCYWDRVRDALIKAMPVCPKDKKIAALEQRIHVLEQQRY